MLIQVARGAVRSHAALYPFVTRASSSFLSTSGSSSGFREEEQLAAAIGDRLSNKAPEAAAQSLVEGLSSQHRAILLAALGSEAARVPTAYVNKLFREADTAEPLQQLDK